MQKVTIPIFQAHQLSAAKSLAGTYKVFYIDEESSNLLCSKLIVCNPDNSLESELPAGKYYTAEVNFITLYGEYWGVMGITEDQNSLSIHLYSRNSKDDGPNNVSILLKFYYPLGEEGSLGLGLYYIPAEDFVLNATAPPSFTRKISAKGFFIRRISKESNDSTGKLFEKGLMIPTQNLGADEQKIYDLLKKQSVIYLQA